MRMEGEGKRKGRRDQGRGREMKVKNIREKACVWRILKRMEERKSGRSRKRRIVCVKENYKRRKHQWREACAWRLLKRMEERKRERSKKRRMKSVKENIRTQKHEWIEKRMERSNENRHPWTEKCVNRGRMRMEEVKGKMKGERDQGKGDGLCKGNHTYTNT